MSSDDEFDCQICGSPTHDTLVHDDHPAPAYSEHMTHVGDFIDWVAQNAAYNGADDEGQRFYDWGLNTWLPRMLMEYAVHLNSRAVVARLIAGYPCKYTPSSRSTGDELYSRWAVCKPCGWRGPDRTRWRDAEADFARHCEEVSA